MSEAKHTPGPWQYLPESQENCAAIVAKTAFVCEFFCGPAEANARLIAAAPDLLNAVRFLLSNHDNRISRPDRDAAYAAIAKATGGAA